MAYDQDKDPNIDADILHLVTKNDNVTVARAYTKDVRRLRQQELDLTAARILFNNIVKRTYWTPEDIRMEAKLMVERLSKQ